MTSNRLRSIAGLALASTVLLTGCDSTPAFNPGVAARVGGETISLGTVADVSKAYCSAAAEQFPEGQVLPGHYVSDRVAGTLALRLAADEFAADLGVSADEEYAQAEEAFRLSLGALTEDQQEAVVDVEGASTYVGAVQKAAGEKILADEGRTAGERAARRLGQEAFVAWLDDNDVRIDPRFSVAIVDGEIAGNDTSLSFALGQTATAADAGSPDTEYAAALPESQRCG